MVLVLNINGKFSFLKYFNKEKDLKVINIIIIVNILFIGKIISFGNYLGKLVIYKFIFIFDF